MIDCKSSILIIDNYDSFTWNLVHLVAKVSGESPRVIRNNEYSLEAITQWTISHLILSPGPGTPQDAGCTLKTISYFQSKIPILGVCLGHQAIAEAFGAQVRPSGAPMHGKQSVVAHTQQGIFKEIPSPLTVARYHSLIVEPTTVAPPLTVQATTGDSTIMSVAVEEKNIWGVQFHPESFLTEYGEQVMRNFIEMKCGPRS